MENKSVIYKILEKAIRKVSAAEVGYGESRKRKILFENDRLKSLEEGYGDSVSLRVIKNSRVGVASTNDFSRINDLVGRAVRASAYGPKAYFEFFKPGDNYPKVKILDDSLNKLEESRIINEIKGAIEEIKSINSKVRVSASVSQRWGKSILLNSSGLELSSETTSLSFYAYGDLVKEGDMLQVGQSESFCGGRPFSMGKIIGEIKERFRIALKVVSFYSGKYPVIFSPEATDSVLGYIFNALSGKQVLEKTSRLGDKQGKKVFDARFSLEDNGLIDWKVGSGPYDSDGVPVAPLVLVDRGVVGNFYYDLQTAGKAKVKPTGHGERGSTASLPVPSPSNLIVGAGTVSYRKLLGDIKEGLLVFDVLGAGQDNPYNGDFSMNVNLGFRVVNGEPVGRVKNVMIAGNIFDLLKDGLLWLSKDVEWHGSLCTPYICFDDVIVTTKN